MSTMFQNLKPGQFTPKYVELAHSLICDIAGRGLREGDRLPTENEIAEQYALSRVTVRQALDLLEQEGLVSRQRARGTFVKKAIDELGQFGILRGTVLLVCSNEQRLHMDEDVAFAEVLCAMEQALADRGFVVQLATLGRSAEEDRERLRRSAIVPDLCGVVAIGPFLEPYRDLFAGQVIVTVGTFQPTAPPWIGADLTKSSREMTAYLLKQGHRRIALVCGGSSEPGVLQPFLAGYKQAHEAAKVVWDRRLVFHLHPDEAPDELAEHALRATPPATAVVADNWQVCQALIRAAQRYGLNIPDDLSLVGYGVNMLGIIHPVPITAQVPHYVEVGRAAARLLLAIIDGRPVESQTIYIPSELVERNSVRRVAPVA